MYRRRKILEAGQRASIKFKKHMWTTTEKVRVGRTLYLLIERGFSPALFKEYIQTAKSNYQKITYFRF